MSIRKLTPDEHCQIQDTIEDLLTTGWCMADASEYRRVAANLRKASIMAEIAACLAVGKPGATAPLIRKMQEMGCIDELPYEVLVKCMG